VEFFERAQLAAERRSGVGAEDERDRLLPREAREAHGAAAVEQRKLEVEGGISPSELRRPQVAVDL
jgi:hypothetical protein